MRFHVTGDTVYLAGQPVATLNPTMTATLRDEVELFLHGRPLDCCDITRRDMEDETEAAFEAGYEAGLEDGHE